MKNIEINPPGNKNHLSKYEEALVFAKAYM